MKIAVSGSTGLIGSALVEALRERGADVVRLVRPPRTAGVGTLLWDPDRGTIDRAGLEGVDAVIHLSGENVFGRWSAAKKQRIRESRVGSTRLISDAIAGLAQRPATLLAASAIGYYGDQGAAELTERSPAGDDFLAEVAREWEAATASAARAGVRVVNMRFGVVLTPNGGALGKMLPPFRLGVGGPVGSGSQYVSWIERDDLTRAIQHVLDRQDLAGPVNMTAPTPVTNREMASILGKVLHRPALLPVPSFVLKMAFGAEGAELLESSQRVLPERLTASGFTFRFPTLEPALRHLLAAAGSGP
ncbi:MAG TPA: TIGR01777 family oxidoreductase [Gemmatimonadales bacterium]|nr:TIGR01777 family oxidoreductase [Gemmatimonadales bacterium]